MFITVINGKRTYRMSEIMRIAWVIFRAEKCSFSDALKKAWARARSVMRSILAVEEEKDNQAALLDKYKAKVDAASSEEEVEEILEDADLDPHFYGKLFDYACSRVAERPALEVTGAERKCQE